MNKYIKEDYIRDICDKIENKKIEMVQYYKDNKTETYIIITNGYQITLSGKNIKLNGEINE